MGAFHSAKNSGFKFQSQAITFQVSYETTNSKTRLENIKMTDSVPLLLELFDDSEIEYISEYHKQQLIYQVDSSDGLMVSVSDKT